MIHAGCLVTKGKLSPEETAYRNDNECGASDSKAAVCEYLWHVDRKQGRRPGDCTSSLGCIATVVVTVFGAVIGSLLVWYYLVLTVSRTVRPTEKNGAILCYVLVVLWFPFRLYGDWYFNFYNASFAETSGRIIFLAFMFAVILVWLILLLRIPRTGALLFGLTTAVPMAIGVGAAINPVLFTGVSMIVGAFGLADYLLAISVVIITFWVISYQFVVGPGMESDAGAAADGAEGP